MLQEPPWPWRTMMSLLIENGKPAAMTRSISKEHCLKQYYKKITKVVEDDALKKKDVNFGLMSARKIPMLL